MTSDDRDLISRLLCVAESFRVHGDGPSTAALLRRAAERLRDLAPSSPEFEQVVDGEWFEPKPQHGHLMKCCDCGLVHRMNFRVSDGRVQLQAFRLTTTDQPAAAPVWYCSECDFAFQSDKKVCPRCHPDGVIRYPSATDKSAAADKP